MRLCLPLALSPSLPVFFSLCLGKLIHARQHQPRRLDLGLVADEETFRETLGAIEQKVAAAKADFDLCFPLADLYTGTL